ncbi:chromate transport protein ChrA [Purpureocillium lilacinum]|uniref:Chromate transport protein ChrA n=1 Tax=Purpureocillium lilacinum TaxID=33203 RepID=A0A179H7E4_PURLI|nr:chromate transport protein ChrA [Purpureocillium lilacinum]OAQ85463.1 chromate transport protein ChrA [Purpureocillium lilacinum]
MAVGQRFRAPRWLRLDLHLRPGADLGPRLWTTVRETWHLGFTAFGGPPVHFKLFYDKFVTRLGWVDEQVYQELFSVCQALSGPASTKMLYCVLLLHLGFIPAVAGFFIWSLPGAAGMYALSVGVSSVGETLPGPAYALLSGLNAATVGIIALAATQLAGQAITDRLSRALVYLAAAAGTLYNALWYFPLLMAVAGAAAVVHDYRWVHRPVRWVVGVWRRARGCAVRRTEVDVRSVENELGQQQQQQQQPPVDEEQQQQQQGREGEGHPDEDDSRRVVPPGRRLNMSWKTGLALAAGFFVSFAAVMAARGALKPASAQPLLFRLFANMYLAGTIIFGGGPVVVPLLREYIVAEGWVSPRDFLIGLALIQAFPGPNFNFAVYLGGLAARHQHHHHAGDGSGNGGSGSGSGSGLAGAAIGFAGIFIPGLVLVHAMTGVWGAARGRRWVRSLLRGVNAGAVGLVFTAVYRLWQMGRVDAGAQAGAALGDEPWWVAVAAGSYVGGAWFGVRPPVAIVAGAVLGLLWYAVVSR